MSLHCDLHVRRAGFDLQARFDTGARVTAIFGPSGSGKSTLLHLLAGLLTAETGRIVLDDRVLFDSGRRINLPAHQRRIGLVFQDSQLFPHLNVRQNLNYGLRLLTKAGQRFSFGQITELLELGELLQRRPQHLSGGQKQRVALGRALLASPSLLLLDEPLAALDERLKQQILPFLQRVKTEIQIPMLYVSHAINEILYLTDQIIMIDRGRLVSQGSFAESIAKTEVLRLAQSLGLENVLTVAVTAHDTGLGYTLGHCHGATVYLPLLSSAPGTTSFVIARAASVALARTPIHGTSIQNQLPGIVRRLTPVAQRFLVEVDIGQPLLAEISLKAAHDLHLNPGDSVVCLIKTQSFSVLGNSHG